MKKVDTNISRLAAGQHGLVRHRQAVAAGMTSRQIQSRVAGGLLVPVHRGVYRVAGSAPSSEQALLAACLAAAHGAVASHRGAAWLWKLRGFDEAYVEVTVPVGQSVVPGAVVHRTRTLDRPDTSRARAVPTTTPARTLLDLGAVVDAERVEAAMEDALLRRLVTLPGLTTAIERLGRSGRNGSAVLRRLVAERDPAARPTESVLEDELLHVLRRAGLPDPVRQHRVGRVRLDLAYPSFKVGIEADGRIWHGGRTDVQRNTDKANALAARGWRVLHFTAHDVRARPDYVARQVEVACPA